jgi:peptide/nickel transport system substrate-binding protein
MRNKIIWLIVSCLMVLSMVLVSCGTKTPTTTPTTKPTQAAGIPQYGGTFTYRQNVDATYWDPYFVVGAGGAILGTGLTYESLGMPDLTIDRNVWDYKTTFIPVKYSAGRLAESWELPDPQTIVFHIRKGVKFQDIAPVNGREMTAYDIEYKYNRENGLGGGFTKRSPYIDSAMFALVTSVTATDKYTVVFKLSQPSLEQQVSLLSQGYNKIYAKEAVDKWGDINKWDRMIGTGPFIIDDYVSGSSATYIKNPLYWGYDELYPKNQLPYVDKVKILVIPDNATALAALRTGKIDMIERLLWQSVYPLKQTNPELKIATRPDNGYAILVHVDTKPFNDIRVRKAMQMSIDIPMITESYYGGYASKVPMGLSGLQGYYTPFDKWPQDVKDGYTYNPEGAKKLLADAGYPTGFKFTLTASTAADLDLAQIAKSYLGAIGIDMSIQTLDGAAFSAYTSADKHETMWQYGTFQNYPPGPITNQRYSKSYPFRHHIKDATFDGYWNALKTALTDDEQVQIIIDADAYATAQQWTINMPAFNNFVLYQPWLNRFNGEAYSTDGILSEASARFWIDQKLKASLGH